MKCFKLNNKTSLRRFVLFILLGLAPGVALQAQTIKGKIRDKSAQPIIGASVVVKGTGAGLISDLEGTYTIQLPESVQNPVLVFSFVGYATQEVSVHNRTEIDIVLEEQAEAIDEVVVVGYGVMRKSDLTGSVVSMAVDDKDAVQGAGIDKLLQGRVPGVYVNSSSGAPGATVDVRIRGVSSLGGDNEPLYVVDGMLMDAREDVKNPFSSGGQEGQNGLTGVNSSDIARVEVLKDASATAIYGSRGANGVILITTKQGASDTPRVEVNTSVGISSINKTLPMMDGGTYFRYREEIGNPIKNNYTYEQALANTVNWQKEVTRQAVSQNYRVSVSGRTKAKNATSYYVAAGYSNIQGVIESTGVKNGDLRLNIDQKLGDKFKLSMRSYATSRKNDWMEGTEPSGAINTSLIRSMIQSPPIRGLNFQSSSEEILDDEDVVSSPNAWIGGYDDRSKEFRVMSNIDLDCFITKGLTLRLSANGDYRDKERSRWYSNQVFPGKQVNGKAGWANMKSTMYTVNALLLYDFTFDKRHKLNGTVGVTFDEKRVENKTITAEDFPNQSHGFLGIAGGLKTTPMLLDYPRTRVFSVLARVNYSYADKYLLTFTGRYDGASRFAKGRKFGFFPSLAFAWRVNQEEFLKQAEWVSNLKLRAGWGQVGKQSINPYQTIQDYSIGFTPSADGYDVAYSPNNIANSQLTWETTTQYNVGIDAGFFSNRLNVTVDLYYKLTEDLLQNRMLPSSTGFTMMAVNRGEIENKGIEVGLDALLVNSKRFVWEVGFNGSWNRNLLKSIGLPSQYFSYQIANAKGYNGSNLSSNVVQTPANIFLEGRPIGMFFGLHTDGIAQGPKFTSDGRPVMWNGEQIVGGMLNYTDVNDDGVIDQHDRVLLGNPNPDFVYGFNTHLAWRGISLDMQFNGVLGKDVLNGNLFMENYQVGGSDKNRRMDAYQLAWRAGDPNGTNAGTRYQSLTATQPSQVASWCVEDGSYLRLSNITLAYDVPFKNKNRAIKGLNIFASVNNVCVWTDYSGFDPEVNSFSGNSGIFGVDWNSYPPVRSYVFGVKLTF